MSESSKSNGAQNSSHDNSILLTDRSRALEDFQGFAKHDGTPESDMKDPFNAVFYHAMPLKDSTNIIFYNKPLYENTLSVLSEEFNFPSKDTRKFHIQTHVDGKKYFIDRDVMSLCASGPGHIFWKENNFT